MKRSVFVVMLLTSLQIDGMEKNQLEMHSFAQLPAEIKTKIIKVIGKSNRVIEAIENFKRLRCTAKLFSTQWAHSSFLDALNKKYPDQEVRISRALHNNKAKKWLLKVKPDCPYQPTTKQLYDPQHIINLAYTLSNADNNEFKNEVKAELLKQLDHGQDPNTIYLNTTFTCLLCNDGNLDVVSALVSHGLNVRGHFQRWDVHAQKVVLDKTLTLSFTTKSAPKIYAYLTQEGAV